MGTRIFGLISYHPPSFKPEFDGSGLASIMSQSRKPTWLLPVAASFTAEFVTKPSALSAIYLLNLNLKENLFS